MLTFCMNYLFIIFITLLLFACGESSNTNSDNDNSDEINSEY